jgi:hypothetical protein
MRPTGIALYKMVTKLLHFARRAASKFLAERWGGEEAKRRRGEEAKM